MEDPVRDAGNGNRVFGSLASFEESVAAGIEEVAAASGQIELGSVAAAVIDEAEQCEELRPGSEALVHRVGIPGRVVAEPLEEAPDAVMVSVNGIRREQSAILGEEDEYQPQQNREQTLVDLITGQDSLRAGCDRDHAAATFFAMVNSHCYQLLATHLGWTPADWQQWLTSVLDRELFGP